MHDVQLITIGLGIVLGMIFYHRTGRSCGGIITPGILALQIHDPHGVAWAVGTAILLSLILEGVVRYTGIYGRQRIATAMIMALGAKLFLDYLFPASSLWLGWVIPGLMAADMQRQGIGDTLIGTVIVTIVTAMTLESVVFLGQILGA